MLLPLFDQFSRRRRIYVSMIVSDTLEHSEPLRETAPSHAGPSNDTSKTIESFV